MNNRLIKVVVNGTAYEVEVGDLGCSPATVIVNGKPYAVEIETRLKAGEIRENRPAKPDVKTIPVEAVAKKPAGKKETTLPGAANENEVRAPMPGTILNVVVKPGANVCRGDPLCALEAMKMKSAIRSPKAGVIASVEVTDGQKVAYGDVLIRYA